MTKAELDYSRSLMAETNSILAGLGSAKIHDAVNWCDLVCTAVEKVKTFSGNATSTEWRVLIEEASPDAYEFRTLVAEGLARRGYSGVAVVTVAAGTAAAVSHLIPGGSTPRQPSRTRPAPSALLVTRLTRPLFTPVIAEFRQP